MNDIDRYQEGFRNGFEAGKASALRELSASVKIERHKRAAKSYRTPKCVCGHAASTHNDQGYCQARHDKDTPKGINFGCMCSGFRDPQPADVHPEETP